MQANQANYSYSGTSFSNHNPEAEGRIDFANGHLVVNAGDGNDNIDLKWHPDGSLTVSINGETHHFSAEHAKNVEILGGNGDDNITVTGDTPADATLTLKGNAGNDVLQGSDGAENFVGGVGNDTIIGLGGDDRIDGSDGDDRLYGVKALITSMDKGAPMLGFSTRTIDARIFTTS